MTMRSALAAPYAELALTPYGSASTLIVGPLSATPVIGDVVLTEGAPTSDRSSQVPDPSELRATIYDPAMSAALSPRLEPGATVELRLNNSRLPRWRGELVAADRDEHDRVRCRWQSPIRRLLAARGEAIPAGATARTPRQMLDALAAASGLTAAGAGQGTVQQRMEIPLGRDGLLQVADLGRAELLDETWIAAGPRVRMRPLSAAVSPQTRRVTDLPEAAGLLSAILVPPAQRHVDPWGVVNSAALELTVSALQGFQLRVGSGADSMISLRDMSLGTHTHTDTLAAAGTVTIGGRAYPVSVTLSGTIDEAEVVGSPEDVAIPAVELTLQVDPEQAVLVDRTYTFRAASAASIARYGRRERERPMRMALLVQARSWTELDAATPALAGSALAAIPTDAAQQAYLDILAGGLRDAPLPVYEIHHDTHQGPWAAAQLPLRRVGWRERMQLRAEGGALRTMRATALETTFHRAGWASQRAWYVRA